MLIDFDALCRDGWPAYCAALRLLAVEVETLHRDLAELNTTLEECRMYLGPATHAGSEWRKLCRSLDLDTEEATAETVTAALRRDPIDITTTPTDHRILLAVQRQVAGLRAEKQAQQEQIDGLVAERDALRAELEATRNGQMSLILEEETA